MTDLANAGADTPEYESDLALAAFSDRGPWEVKLEEARWRDRVDTIRSAVEREIPNLIRPKRVPAGGRLVEVAGRLGGAIALWYGTGRRRGGSESTACLLYTSPSPRDRTRSRMPSSA